MTVSRLPNRHIAAGVAADRTISVVLPVYNGSAFVVRAVESVLRQTIGSWELIVVDDGSSDGTPEIVRPYTADPRVRLEVLPRNVGMPAALNRGLDLATAPLVGYIAADDIFFPEHLATLAATLESSPDAVAAFSGVHHGFDQECEGQIPGHPLQLLQVMHRRTARRWIDRTELVSHDHGLLFWDALAEDGSFEPTGKVTGWWVDHPDQMHKHLRESLMGGLNRFRARYNVEHPLRFKAEKDVVDEYELYERFRNRPSSRSSDGLKILLVGELAYNPERIVALEEAGHELYGLWTPDGWWFNTVGPLPFGNVRDIDPTNWVEEVRRIKPDVIYGLLNWQSVPWAHHVLKHNPGIPFVWHFKEGPMSCMEHGTWKQLVDLQTRSDAQIYSSPETRDWFEALLPGRINHPATMVLDGDLPKADWFTDVRTPLLSSSDGEIHTVLLGRAIGVEPELVGDLASRGIHMHFYGMVSHDPKATSQHAHWIARAKELAGRYVHFHPAVDQRYWVEEFSQYDAGWLHVTTSTNDGDIHRAQWGDLNLPCRISTMAAAGLPWIQRDNRPSLVATESLAARLGVDVSYTSVDSLEAMLRDSAAMAAKRERMWEVRRQFTFDYHVGELVDLFRTVRESRVRSVTDVTARASRVSRVITVPEAGTRIGSGSPA